MQTLVFDPKLSIAEALAFQLAFNNLEVEVTVQQTKVEVPYSSVARCLQMKDAVRSELIEMGVGFALSADLIRLFWEKLGKAAKEMESPRHVFLLARSNKKT